MIYNFKGKFYIRLVSDYTTSDRKFGSDLMGKKGGDQFDFHVDGVELAQEREDGEDVTRVDIEGWFKKPTQGKWTKEELTDELMEQICDYVESFTKKYPQMFSLSIDKLVVKK